MSGVNSHDQSAEKTVHANVSLWRSSCENLMNNDECMTTELSRGQTTNRTAGKQDATFGSKGWSLELSWKLKLPKTQGGTRVESRFTKNKDEKRHACSSPGRRKRFHHYASRPIDWDVPIVPWDNVNAHAECVALYDSLDAAQEKAIILDGICDNKRIMMITPGSLETCTHESVKSDCKTPQCPRSPHSQNVLSHKPGRCEHEARLY